ncbi:hypothetical protein [Paenibacillus albiflavus]|uniref:hypothetical protein n=1 Tax=Paenibacillus albiflavus TaxID=2545760 RepID=UPI00140471FE|nr:hypothetical protein [Paenibacillus albiflavus]
MNKMVIGLLLHVRKVDRSTSKISARTWWGRLIAGLDQGSQVDEVKVFEFFGGDLPVFD